MASRLLVCREERGCAPRTAGRSRDAGQESPQGRPRPVPPRPAFDTTIRRFTSAAAGPTGSFARRPRARARPGSAPPSGSGSSTRTGSPAAARGRCPRARRTARSIRPPGRRTSTATSHGVRPPTSVHPSARTSASPPAISRTSAAVHGESIQGPLFGPPHPDCSRSRRSSVAARAAPGSRPRSFGHTAPARARPGPAPRVAPV